MNTPTTPTGPEPGHSSSSTSLSATDGAPRRGVGALVDIAPTARLVQDLEDVALLLHQAALAAWEIGDREGLTSEMHYLGLGVYLAQGNTVALLPADHVMSQSWPPVGPPAENDPARLVGSAETRLRALSPNATTGLSDLVLEVCDLAREFKDFRELAQAQRTEEVHRHGS